MTTHCYTNHRGGRLQLLHMYTLIGNCLEYIASHCSAILGESCQKAGAAALAGEARNGPKCQKSWVGPALHWLRIMNSRHYQQAWQIASGDSEHQVAISVTGCYPGIGVAAFHDTETCTVLSEVSGLTQTINAIKNIRDLLLTTIGSYTLLFKCGKTT